MQVIPQHLLKYIVGGSRGADNDCGSGGGSHDGVEPPLH